MKPSAAFVSVISLAGFLAAPTAASGAFHLMQIEQVIGGVNCDPTVQAVQLRMRFSGENFVAGTRIRAWDAAGQNPVVIITFPSNVSSGAGRRILVTSSNFADHTSPSVVPDFTMTNLIPESYLAAGSLTFEDGGGTLWWRLSWGGTSYTGPGTVQAGGSTVANDADGNANPPFPGSLPSTSTQALLFQGSASAQSTNNADDYELTAGDAVFTNNAFANFTVISGPTGACCDDATGDCTEGCSQAGCESAGFRYGGDDSTCETIDPPCEPPPTGACCDDDTGSCSDDQTFDECNAAGFRYGGDDSTCLTIDPPCEPPPTGACCNDPKLDCTENVTEDDCNAAGFRYGGDGSTCATIDPTCSPPEPGACCVRLTGVCLTAVSQEFCDGEGGEYGGDGSTCDDIAPPCEPVIAISLEQVADGLISPVHVTHAGDETGRLFIVDQAGFIRIVDADGNLLEEPFLDLTTEIIEPNTGFDERGVLGLAFHPGYAKNGRFFVRYSKPRVGSNNEPCFGTSRGCHSEILAEFSVDPLDANKALLSSQKILFSVDEPEFNHNAGAVAFGPDGKLYFSLGDGGGANDDLHRDGVCDAGTCSDETSCSVSVQDCADESECISNLGFCTISSGLCGDGSTCEPNPLAPPHGPIGHGQNPATHLGSLLRIDVDADPPDEGLEYAIPPDNPFVGNEQALDEIWAFGFRNPFTFVFDDGPGGNGALFLGDVGQRLFEEINIIAQGGNYGWAVREGFHCFDPFNVLVPPDDCSDVGVVLGDPMLDPVSEYLQSVACESDADCAPLGVGCGNNGLCLNEGGISVILGGVYRGTRVPSLVGKLVYGDFSRTFAPPGGRLYYFDTSGPETFQRRRFFLTPNNDPLGEYVKGFGVDEEGEIYVCTSTALGPTGTTGRVLRIGPPAPGMSLPGSRYLAINPPLVPDTFALAVTPDCPGAPTRYVGMPSGPENRAVLVSDPVFLTVEQWGLEVRVTGVEIVPEVPYRVRADFGSPGSPAFSPSALSTTQRWGDMAGEFQKGQWTPPNGLVTVTDVVAQIDRVLGRPIGPAVYLSDLVGASDTGVGCRPDGAVLISDVVAGVDAIRQIPFASTSGCPNPCPPPTQ